MTRKCSSRICFNLAEPDEQHCRACLGPAASRSRKQRENQSAGSAVTDDPLPKAKPIMPDVKRVQLYRAVCWMCSRDWWLQLTEEYCRLLCSTALRCVACGGLVGVEQVNPLYKSEKQIGRLVPHDRD